MKLDMKNLGVFLMKSVIFLVGFILLNLLSISFQLETTITPWYLPPGMYIAMFYFCGLVYTVVLFAIIILVATSFFGLNLLEAMILGIIISTGYGIITWLMRKTYEGRQISMINISTIKIMPIIFALPLAIGIVNALLVPDEILNFIPRVVTFWLGDLLGIITIAPLLFAIAFEYQDRKEQNLSFIDSKRLGEMIKNENYVFPILVIITLITLSIISFSQPYGLNLFFLVIIPFLINSLAKTEKRFLFQTGIINIMIFLILISNQFDIGALEFIEFQIEILASGLMSVFLFVSYSRTRDETLAKEEIASRLVQAERFDALGRLAGGIAHDFNNLMHVVRTNTEYISLDDQLSPDIKSSLETIDQSLERGSELIDQILTFGKSKSLRLSKVDVNEFIKTRSEIFEGLIDDLHIIDHHFEPLPDIALDQLQFEQVFINMIANARDSMPEGGKIGISTRFVKVEREMEGVVGNILPQDYIVITISDQGSGIRHDIQGLIFDPFFTTKPKGKGAGLGLSIVLGIIQNHEGHILLRSGNQGTSFELYFPLTTELKAENEIITRLDEEVAGEIPQDIHVIIVDDNEELLNGISAYFDQKGVKYTAYQSPIECLRDLQNEEMNFDILISDVIMPNLNGVTLADEMKQKYPNIPVIFITGYPDKFLNTGIDFEYTTLQKPFTMDQMFKEICLVVVNPS
ncbi:MAG: ATP-binding protein [Candidatus Kariarchaeaceae archaeon]|jgi:signal transduction histidine kinase/CheY-like chemotaxis protein